MSDNCWGSLCKTVADYGKALRMTMLKINETGITGGW